MTTRLAVMKTYKLYIGGQFPRTESEHYFQVRSKKGEHLANMCKGSRKDVRNAIVAARNAFSGWSSKTALNRGQILYRAAEVFESRAAEFRTELTQMGATLKQARAEVECAIDTLIYYAGWSDKYAAVLGSVNPVSGPFYNFSMPEPTGVVGIVAPEKPALAGLVARIAPAIVSGNTVVALASEQQPLAAATFAEVLATSDVPGGVVNIITGMKDDLCGWMASHMDVNLVDLTGVAAKKRSALVKAAADNVKRVIGQDADDNIPAPSLWILADFLETKTVWHPIGA